MMNLSCLVCQSYKVGVMLDRCLPNWSPRTTFGADSGVANWIEARWVVSEIKRADVL